jgi:hypothetical protein
MYRRTDPQPSLFVTGNFFHGEKLRRLEENWPGQFRRHALPMIDEDLFRDLYHQDNGRPNKPVRLLVGLLILKEMYDLTDQEALDALEFDLRWHLALEQTPEEAHCCQKTLHNFRTALYDNQKVSQLFDDMVEKIIAALGLSVEKQRLDSTHIVSNIARLTRLRLFCETTRLFLCELRAAFPERFEALSEALRRRYLKEDGKPTAYQDARRDEAPRRLGVCARDLARLVDRFRGDPPVQALASHALLGRLFAEQCVVVKEPVASAPGDADALEAPVAVVLKEPADVSSASLQTPHDPDVTYSGHKGKGYEAQVAETHGNGEKPEIITHVEVTDSCGSDDAAAVPVLNALIENGLQPKEMEADTSYGSTENVLAFAEAGTELVSPVAGSKGKKAGEEAASPSPAFQLDVVGAGPVRCPAGHVAEEVKRTETGRIEARFPAERCVGCALADGCPSRQNVDGTRVYRTTRKAHLLEQRRRYQGTPEFRARYAMRAGAEASNSELKRSHGLGRLRVRGGLRVRLAVYFKVLACNVKRMIRYFAEVAAKGSGIGPEGDSREVFAALWALLHAVRRIVPSGTPQVILSQSPFAHAQHLCAA